MKRIVLFLCLAIVVCQGAVINVSSAGSVSAAINSSSPGDTIELANGIYEGAQNLGLVVTGYNLSFTSASGVPGDVIFQCNFDYEVFIVGQKGLVQPNASTYLSINGVTFRNCGKGAGGGVYAETLYYTYSVAIEITNCEFRDNQVAGEGGAIYTFGSLAPITLTIFNTNFIGNRAVYGGAIYIHGTTLNITNSVFSGNEADYSGGAGFILTGTNATITNTNFLLNRADQQSGGALVIYDNTYVNADTVTFRQNSAPQGGAILIDTTQSPIFAANTFDQNVAQEGGAIYFFQATASLLSSTFSNNQAFGGGSGGGGALIAWEGSVINAAFNLFIGNSGDQGGVVALDGSSTDFESNDFENNWSGEDGGAFYLQDGAKLYIKYGTLMNNTATMRGDSVYCNGSSVSFDGVNILQYTAKANEVNGFVCAVNTSSTQKSSCQIAVLDSGDFTGVCTAGSLDTGSEDDATTTTGAPRKSSHHLANWKLALIIVGSVVGAALIVSIVAFAISKRGPTSFLQFK